MPPPRSNNTRYHGVLAPNSKLRSQVVPVSTDEEKVDNQEKKGSRKYRLSWSALLARIFQIDVSVCPDCGGPMKIIAFITDPNSVRRYLRGVGLPTEPPAVAAARPPPQAEFDF